MTPRPYPSLITLFPWGNVFRVSHDYSSKEVLANKPICKSGTVCLPALAVLLLVPLDLTCSHVQLLGGPRKLLLL